MVETRPVADKIEDAIQRELERWDGIAELPALASRIAPYVRRRILSVLTRNGVDTSRKTARKAIKRRVQAAYDRGRADALNQLEVGEPLLRSIPCQ